MLGHRIFATAAIVLGCALTASPAHAAPVLLLPDVNFVTHGNTFCITGARDFTLTVDSTKGDLISIDRGRGFSPITATIMTTGSRDIRVSFGELSMDAVKQSVSIRNSAVGRDLFAIFKVTQSSIAGFRVGQLVAVDGLVFNIDKNHCGQIKGDVAPIVPEPATLSLLVLGLGGLASAARRKLV